MSVQEEPISAEGDPFCLQQRPSPCHPYPGAQFQRSESATGYFETEGDPSFEAMLAVRLQQLQAFILDEVSNRPSYLSVGPRSEVQQIDAHPRLEFGGFGEDVPPQPPCQSQPELMSGIASSMSRSKSEASTTAAPAPYLQILGRGGENSPSRTPKWNTNFKQLHQEQSLESLPAMPMPTTTRIMGRLKQSPSCVSCRTEDDAESVVDGKSISVRMSSTIDYSLDKVVIPQQKFGSEGNEGVTQSDSLASSGMRDNALEPSRTTKLEEVVALMYHCEVGTMDNRTSAESLGFRMQFVNDSNFQSIAVDVVLTVFVFLNIITMGVRTELYQDSYFWDVLDVVFVSAFTLALALRIVGQGVRETLITGPDRGWNWFEVVQISVGLCEISMKMNLMRMDRSIIDPSFFALLRMVRMIRITRILRICRLQIFSELLVMVVGTLGGMKTLIWALALTAVPMYALAIMFRETLGESGGEAGLENFGNFQMAFFTVFRCTVSGECVDSAGRPIMKQVAEQDGWGYVAIFCLMEFFMTFGLYNVVQGIFLENVLAGAKTNELALKRERLRNQAYFAEKMAELLTIVVRSLAGVDHKSAEVISVSDLLLAAADLSITPEDFDRIRKNPEVCTVLKELAVSDEDMMYLFETLDLDGDGHIDLHEFVEGIWKLRGGPRRSDVIANNYMLQKVMSQLQDQGAATSAAFAQQERLLRHVRKAVAPDAGKTMTPSSPRQSKKRNVPRLLIHQDNGSIVPSTANQDRADGRAGITDVPPASAFSRGTSAVDWSESSK